MLEIDSTKWAEQNVSYVYDGPVPINERSRQGPGVGGMNDLQIANKALRRIAKIARRGPSYPNYKEKQRAAEKRLSERNYSHVSAEIEYREEKDEKTGLVTATPVVGAGVTLRKRKDRRIRLTLERAKYGKGRGARRRQELRDARRA